MNDTADFLDESEGRAEEYRVHAEEARRVLSTLVKKLRAIEQSPAYEYVFAFASLHGAPYRGETWNEELWEAEFFLDSNSLKA